jgi:hypothetical protein
LLAIQFVRTVAFAWLVLDFFLDDATAVALNFFLEDTTAVDLDGLATA